MELFPSSGSHKYYAHFPFEFDWSNFYCLLFIFLGGA